MMYSFLLLSTAQAFPMVHVTGCRETEQTKSFDKHADMVMQKLDQFKILDFIPLGVGKIAIRKMINDLGDHARPLLFERVECKDGPGPDFQPCSDLYGDTVCEMVALRKVEDREEEALRQENSFASGIKGLVDEINIFKKKSTCKAIDRLDATAVSVAFRGDFAMTCNMEDSIESMELYIARGKWNDMTRSYWNFYPESCPEGLQLEDPKMKDAVYDKDQKIFTLSHEDVTDKVKCIRKPRIVRAQEVKDDLVSKLRTASKQAPAPYDDHAKKLMDELKKMTPQEFLVHYDELMANPVTKTAEIMNQQIAKDILKDVGKASIDLATEKAKKHLKDLTELIKDKNVVDQAKDQLNNWMKGFF